MPKFRAPLLSLAGAAVAIAVFAGPGAAQDVPAAVKARQSQMQLYAFNLGTLGAMAKGEAEYDAEAAQGAADNLVALTSLAAGPMWAPGTDDMSIDGTRTLATMWDNFPDVMAKGTALAEAAGGMAAAAGTDLASLQAAMGPLGGACSACHKAYRAPE
ncbi:MAG TPA: cytochrome C554 [Rhodobacteraceae bacterium]|nr:cytochrome C554 [Paracoccaceae bacterium]